MDVGHVLENFPPIVENIFKYLSLRDLESCAEVCDLWKRVSETERIHRDIVILFKVLPCMLHEAEHSDLREECSEESLAGDIESDFSQQLREVKINPMFCLAFASTCLFHDFEQFFPNFRYPPTDKVKKPRFRPPSATETKRQKEDLIEKSSYVKAVIQSAFGQYLPEKCRTTFCVAPGIIGCHKDLLPLEIENGFGISSILIPYVPGLQIFSFPADGKRTDISKLIPQDTDIKCLLVFTTKYLSSYGKIIRACLTKQDSKLALGGALLEHTESRCGSFVAFCGQSVEAASIVINYTYREKEIERKLQLFRETGLLKDKCFAFMFACVGRGYSMYQKYNTESSIFHKLYPEVPLIGVFGRGETGFDYLPNVHIKCKKNIVGPDKITHGYTTIFVLVSLKL